jgi:serine/threonine protein kinase
VIDRDASLVRMKRHFKHRNHLCLVYELLSLNLYEVLRLNNFIGIPLSVLRTFSVQILTALQFLSELNIVHCDLKPENVLLRISKGTDVKVIDFGSSCRMNERVCCLLRRFHSFAIDLHIYPKQVLPLT